MTMRTFKVLGTGFGTSPAQITAVLDGQTVFSGEVDLVPQSPAVAAENSPVVFTFDLPLENSGLVAKPMTITVEKAAVCFNMILSNYTQYRLKNGLIVYTGAETFVDASVEAPDGSKDPRSNVSINGVPKRVDRTVAQGAWNWTVQPGQTLACDVTFSDGVEE
jgi:hypothetical protein